MINLHNICHLHWVPWISFSTRWILPFDSPGSVGPSCCSCSRGFHWSDSGHQFVFGTAIVPGGMWDVGCGFNVLPWEFWWCSWSVSTSQIIYQVLLGTPQKKCTETHLVDLWGYGYWIIWYIYIIYIYIYLYIYIYIFMFAWKQQIVDTFRGTCQVSIISTENPPKKSTGCRTHQGTSCTSQNRHLGHQLADAMDLNLWI